MMTKQERAAAEQMSLDVYGNKNHYKKLMKAGKLKEMSPQKTADDGVIVPKRWTALTLDQVMADMQELINKRTQTSGGKDGSQEIGEKQEVEAQERQPSVEAQPEAAGAADGSAGAQ